MKKRIMTPARARHLERLNSRQRDNKPGNEVLRTRTFTENDLYMAWIGDVLKQEGVSQSDFVRRAVRYALELGYSELRPDALRDAE